MKHIDVREPVMDKIIRFEKRKSYLWVILFLFIVFALVALSLLFFWSAAVKIHERQTLDLLQLFGEDREIISEFWQDTLFIIWEELPKTTLIVGGLALLAVTGFILLTKKARMIVWKKIRIIKKLKI